MPRNLQTLPKLKDSLSFIYIDKAIIEQDAMSIVALQGESRISIPIATMTVLMLGPGVSITHAAIKTISDCGCVVVWCGEQAARFYALVMEKLVVPKTSCTKRNYVWTMSCICKLFIVCMSGDFQIWGQQI